MKKLLVLVFGMILMGCGSNAPTAPTTIPENAQKIPFDQNTLILELPENWTIVSGTGGDALFLARNGAENFSLIRRTGWAENVGDIIYKTAKTRLLGFQEISVSSTDWSFQAKSLETTPLRDFRQKIIHLENTDEFALATCSAEVELGGITTCNALLDSVMIWVDNAAEKK